MVSPSLAAHEPRTDTHMHKGEHDKEENKEEE
jgi:hypothetical protein